MDDRAPDLVLHRGQVYLGDADHWASAIAVTDGTITAIGTDDDVTALAGAGTRRVDLDGRTVLPGFIDAHVHPMQGGGELVQCSLAELETQDEYVGAIGAYAAAHPDREWITGGGWSMSAFERGVPAAGPLDGAIGDRPVVLFNRDHHSAWVSSAALRLAGIDAGTPDPVGGRIERDASGRPSGALHESAMDLVTALVPEQSGAERREALLAGQAYLHGFGVTGWQDAKLMTDTDDAGVYEALNAAGELTSRVVGALWLDPARGPEQVADLVARRAASPGGLFTIQSIKIMLDGVCETFTAALGAPYLDGHGHTTGNSGISFFEEDDLRECARLLDLADFQLHFHAVGDAAVTQALDTVEHVLAANGERGNRHHVAHVQVVTPADVLRFRRLRVTVNAQPLWARLEPQMTELTLPFLDADRAGWQYPFGGAESAGARLAFGSDWPVSTPDPIRQLHVAVNRAPAPVKTSWSPADGAFLPEHRLSLPAAIDAFTRGSAFVNRHEQVSGSIAVGRSADLAVLDGNPFDRPREDIWDHRVVQTWFAGQAVHGEPADA